MPKTLGQSVAILAMSAALAFGVNAVRPRGLPLRPMTKSTDRPPDEGVERSADYLLFEDLQFGVELGLATVIDARTAEEYADGHISTAISLPVDLFSKGRPEALDDIPLDANIIVYCDGLDCGSSSIVAEQLRLYGYEIVRVFVDGYPAWLEAGMEAVYGA